MCQNSAVAILTSLLAAKPRNRGSVPGKGGEKKTSFSPLKVRIGSATYTETPSMFTVGKTVGSFTEVKRPKPQADVNFTNTFRWTDTPGYEFTVCRDTVLLH